MALEPVIQYTATGGATPISGISASATTTPTQIDVVERTVAAGLTNQTFTINIDVSQLQTLFLYTDRAATVYTNATSGGAPGHTLTFVANKPLAWVNGAPNANPFASTDVTTFYITNADTANTLTLRGVVSQNI
jgi:hypothetical protein